MNKALAASLSMLLILVAACDVEWDLTGGGSQNEAWLHVPPDGCETGPFSLALINKTDLYISMTIDGADIVFLDEGGYAYGELPPEMTAYLCLEETGTHSITGSAWALRYDELVPVEGDGGSFVWNADLGDSSLASGRHELAIDRALLILQ